MAKAIATTGATTQETSAEEQPAPKPNVQPAAPTKLPAKKIATKGRAAKVSAAPKRKKKPAAKQKRIGKRPLPKKSAAKKPAPKQAAAKKSVRKKSSGKKQPSAKRRSTAQVTNKAQAIRDAAKKLGKNVRPRDIISTLATKGIEVSSAQVSMTLRAAGYRKRRRSRKPKAAIRATATPAVAFAVDDLVTTKRVADQLGGIARLKEALTALERLLR